MFDAFGYYLIDWSYMCIMIIIIYIILQKDQSAEQELKQILKKLIPKYKGWLSK